MREGCSSPSELNNFSLQTVIKVYTTNTYELIAQIRHKLREHNKKFQLAPRFGKTL